MLIINDDYPGPREFNVTCNARQDGQFFELEIEFPKISQYERLVQSQVKNVLQKTKQTSPLYVKELMNTMFIGERTTKSTFNVAYLDK